MTGERTPAGAPPSGAAPAGKSARPTRAAPATRAIDTPGTAAADETSGEAVSQQRLIDSLLRRRSLAASLLMRDTWQPATVAAWPRRSFVLRWPVADLAPELALRASLLGAPGGRVESATWTPEQLFWWRRLSPATPMLARREGAAPPLRNVPPTSPPNPDEPPRVLGEPVPPVPPDPPDLPDLSGGFGDAAGSLPPEASAEPERVE